MRKWNSQEEAGRIEHGIRNNNVTVPVLMRGKQRYAEARGKERKVVETGTTRWRGTEGTGQRGS